jgi:thiamine biosynthesis protein ThiI
MATNRASSSSLFLLRLSGDLSTKAPGTKGRFLSRLMGNVEDALRSSGLEGRVKRDRLRLFLHADPRALDVLPRVFGLQSFSPVEDRPWSRLEDIVDAGVQEFGSVVEGKRFAVRARRGGDPSRIPFGSMDLERELGRRLLPLSAGVDLSAPDVTAYVEVHPEHAFLHTHKVPAPGGLPLGVGGHALALVSGGFDSAVAAWLMLRRGVKLDYLFCNLGGEEHRRGVHRVMKIISDHWSYGSRPVLHEVDFQPVVQELQARTAPSYWQVLLKRRMMDTALAVAPRARATAIVTGEAVGQVSSQTLQNLAVITKGAGLPVLRPLLGFNKDEIISRAREIGTFNLSAEVDEYCALLPRNPATHARWHAVKTEEAKLSPDLLTGVMNSRRECDLRALRLAENNPDLAVDHVPEGAVLLDLRSRPAYDAWHHPDALYLDFWSALRSYRSFAPDRTYVFYCEVGQKSVHLAELMRKEGFRAYSLRERAPSGAAPEVADGGRGLSAPSRR